MKRLFAAFVAALAMTVSAFAAGYPEKTVTIVVPFPPGGSTDAIARVLSVKLSERWGHNLVVDNKPGATGTIAATYVAKSAADGYTIFLGSQSTMLVAPNIYPKLQFDPVKDFTPISMLVSMPMALAVHPSVPAKDMQELIALAKKGKLSYASAGSGGPQHVAGELFKTVAGINITHVPYKGGGPAWAALLAGNIDLLFDSMPGPLPYGNRVRPLAIAGPERLPGLPNVPTFAEIGMPEVSTIFFWAMVVPAGTPADVVTKLNHALVEALRYPVVKTEFAKQSMETSPSTPEEIARFMADAVPRWREVVKKAGLRQD